jgi:PKHD-type hydroxylase
VILKYYYYYFVSAIPPHICDQILEMGLTAMHEQKERWGEQALTGSVGGWRQKGDRNTITPMGEDTAETLHASGVDLGKTYVRDSNVVFLSNPSLYDLVRPFIHEANAKAGWNFEWDYTEDLQFTKYGVGQFYGWHTDSNADLYEKFDPAVDEIHMNPDGTPFLDQHGEPMAESHNKTPNNNMWGKTRKLSVTISLNDPSEYEGGNLQFDLGPHRPDRFHTATEIRPKGSVVVFPSHVHHQVTPIVSGTRYSLVCWNLGAPFK